MSGNTPVSVRILDKEYQIACPPEERDDLMRCADLLNDRMREIRDNGKVIGLERVAVMAALNISHDLLRASSVDDKLDDAMGDRLKSLRHRVEAVLENSQQLEL
ncbi:MAG: cell division protein ZapA [Gammaproteobacteria bacterium]|nr:cell division protein ZapA [Gammaproteobacteria bacterium]